MLMSRIEASAHWRNFIVVRLLRRWSAEAAVGGSQLPSLVSLAGELGERPETAVAVASLFQLTESCLGRPLRAECCCSPRFGRDEQAILLLLDAAPGIGPPRSTPAVPHGLPGALVWAARSVRHLLGETSSAHTALPRSCPFGG